MNQLAFASAAFSMSTPVGRAVSSPDRSQQQVPKIQQHEKTSIEKPSVAEDFAARLTPEEFQLAQSRAEKQDREALERATLLHDEPEAQERQFLIYTVFVLLTGAKMAARLKQIGGAALPDEGPTPEPAAAQANPKRGPGRPKANAAAVRQRMPPVPHMRRIEESEAPVPVGPRLRQPTPEEVMDKYRKLKPPSRTGRVG